VTKRPKRRVAKKRVAKKRGRPARRAPRAKPLRWNPEPEDVQRSVVKLVLSLIEFIRKLMERQAVRRLEDKTLTPEEIENVGIALMKLEQTVYQLAKRFKLDPKDLNLDLGPIGKLH
jgi:trimethylamine:corrinoid methyltransferase-like protein